MDLTSGCPFWPIKDGLIASYPPLDRDSTCEVAVIGGGISGALVAYHLVQAGVDTLLMDKRDIGLGSTAASTSLLQYENDVPLSRLIRLRGERSAVRSYELCRDAVGKIQKLARKLDPGCGCPRRESIYLASHLRDLPALQREFAVRYRCGFAVDFWTRGQIAAVSSLPHAGAIVSREAGEIDAYRFTHALLAGGRRRGLRVFDRTGVASCRVRPRGVDLLTFRGPRVRAKKVVIATGYEAMDHWSARFTALHSTYAVVSEPLADFPGWPGERLIWETARPYFYLRRTSDGRAIIGGGDEPFRDPQRRDKLLPAKTQLLVRKFRALFPKIKFEAAYAWTGTFAETADGLPYIGERRGSPHTYFALGYGGNGITYSLVAAEIIRDLYLGRENSDTEIFRFDRPASPRE